MKAGDFGVDSKREPADYFRTVRGQRTAFSGSPGKGMPVGGHPRIVSALQLHPRTPRPPAAAVHVHGSPAQEHVELVHAVLQRLPPAMQREVAASGAKVTVAGSVAEVLGRREARTKGVFIYPPPPPQVIIGSSLRGERLSKEQVENTTLHEFGHLFVERRGMLNDRDYRVAWRAGQARTNKSGSDKAVLAGFGVLRKADERRSMHEVGAELLAYIHGAPGRVSERLARCYPEAVDYLRAASGGK